jgi:hypothetical protein
VDKARMVDITMIREVIFRLREVLTRLFQKGFGGGEIVSVDVSDGVSRETDDLASQSQGLFSSLVLGIQVVAGSLGDFGQSVSVQRKDSLPCVPLIVAPCAGTRGPLLAQYGCEDYRL